MALSGWSASAATRAATMIGEPAAADGVEADDGPAACCGAAGAGSSAAIDVAAAVVAAVGELGTSGCWRESGPVWLFVALVCAVSVRAALVAEVRKLAGLDRVGALAGGVEGAARAGLGDAKLRR